MKLHLKRVIYRDNKTVKFDRIEKYNTTYLQNDLLSYKNEYHLKASCLFLNAAYQSGNALISTAAISAVYSFITGELAIVSNTKSIIDSLPEESEYQSKLFPVPDCDLNNVANCFNHIFNMLKYFYFNDKIDISKYISVFDPTFKHFIFENLKEFGYRSEQCEIFLYKVNEEFEEVKHVKELAA